MKLKYRILPVMFSCLIICYQSCRKPLAFDNELLDERLSGGNQTAMDASVGAFEHEFDGLSASELLMHEAGDKAFEQTFVTAPAKFHSGLGPLYNNVSCVSCHVGDGRGRPPKYDGDPTTGLLFRLSMPGEDEHGGPKAVQGFGGQLQSRATFGKPVEATAIINYIQQLGKYDDGENYELQEPHYSFANAYQSMPSGYLYSPRLAPPIFGLGLLEAINESEILKHADEFDTDNDGISGKPNYVWDVKSQSKKLGRFGWKCNQPNLLQQAAGAYNGDMGITSFIFPNENSFGQIQYDNLKDDVELSDSLLIAAAFYTQTLQVPARRNVDDVKVKLGKQLFNQTDCNKCHLTEMTTATDMSRRYLSNQRIAPYTDLLLHDMGNGLADNRPDFLATGNEWRTAPLWGIGLTEIVNGNSYYMHDGRARSITEAILWHGGEAEAAKNKFKKLSKTDREALLAFLKSL